VLEFFTVQINNDNPRSATQVRPFHVGAFIAQLEAKGIKPTVSITEARPGFTIAMVTDPDGNRLSSCRTPARMSQPASDARFAAGVRLFNHRRARERAVVWASPRYPLVSARGTSTKRLPAA
jgi:hypothetical protein